MAALAALGLAACTPALDWRELSPPQSGATLLWPCKPLHQERESPGRSGRPLKMGLATCEADGRQFALSWADLEDPVDVGPALRRMRQAVADKLDVPLPAPESGASAAQPIGATPQPEAIQLSLSAARPGPRAHTQLAVFARGLRVYQLSMLGPRLDEATWAQWLGSVRLN